MVTNAPGNGSSSNPTGVDGRWSRLSGTLQPLGVADYRRMLAANTLWWQGMWMEMIVIGWLVLELTNSPWQVALVGFYRSAPLLVWGFISGPVIDRVGRRRVIQTSQGVNLLAASAIGLLLWTGRLEYWHLCVTAFVLGTAWAFDWPARRSLVPDLVGKARTLDAMLLENFAQIVSRIAGPFSAGALVEALGPTGTYAVLITFSLLALLVLLRLQVPPSTSPKQDFSRPLGTVVDGLRYVRRNPPVFGAFLITVLMNNLTFPYMSMLPVFARDVLGQGPVGLGILGMGNGIGSFIGLLIINRIKSRVPHGTVFAFGSVVQSLALVAFAVSTDFTLSLAMLITSGLGQAAFSVMQSSIVLIHSSDEMRSRAMGSIVLGIGAGPPGRLQVGALAESFGAPLAVGAQTGLCALAVAAVAIALPRFRRDEPA